MPSKFPTERLREIIEECDYILQVTRRLSFDDFKSDPTIRRAVERSFAIISEAAVKLGEDAELLVPNMPWPDIRGLGNVIRHEYGDINYDTLWEICGDEIEPLRTACVEGVSKLDGAD